MFLIFKFRPIRIGLSGLLQLGLSGLLLLSIHGTVTNTFLCTISAQTLSPDKQETPTAQGPSTNDLRRGNGLQEKTPGKKGNDAAAVAAPAKMSFNEWKARCREAPSNRQLEGRLPPNDLLPLPEFASLDRLTREFLQLSVDKGSPLADPAAWQGDSPSNEFFRIDSGFVPPFRPFAEKRSFPPGTEFIFHGDFHGDVRSLIATIEWLNQQGTLDGFKIRKANTHLVFLGDYADRGAYGIEVFYTLWRLKLDNPNQVILVRGNHEDVQLMANYGFLREGELKYGRQFNPYPLLRSFDFLPVVTYLGVGENYLQCNHGGMEPGYDPLPLLESERSFHLLGELRQRAFAEKQPEWDKPTGGTPLDQSLLTKLQDFSPTSPTGPATLGFMWNDFMLFSDEPALAYNENRLAFIFGQTATEFLLKKSSSRRIKLQGVIRAHQHSSLPDPMMRRLVASRGVFRHWQEKDGSHQENAAVEALAKTVEVEPVRSIPSGSVWTFNVSPDSIYGVKNHYTFDTIGIVKTAANFRDWQMHVVNIPVKQ